MDGSLRCFVARQLLLQIYPLSSVRYPHLKLRLCKKHDKYEVCLFMDYVVMIVIIIVMIVDILCTIICVVVTIHDCVWLRWFWINFEHWFQWWFWWPGGSGGGAGDLSALGVTCISQCWHFASFNYPQNDDGNGNLTLQQDQEFIVVPICSDRSSLGYHALLLVLLSFVACSVTVGARKLCTQ